MRPGWTLLLYAARSAFRYRSNWMWPVTSPLLLALPALLVAAWGERAGTVAAFADLAGTRGYAAYLLLGALYWNFVEIVWWIPWGLRTAMREGTLESLLATGIPRLALLGAWAGSRVLVVLPSFAVGAALVAAWAGVPRDLWVAVLVLLLSALGSGGLAFLLFGLTLRFKDAGSLISLLGNTAPLLGGVFFPVALLPQPLRALSLLYPFTYGADALRGVWFRSPTLFPLPAQLAILGGLSLAYLALGWAALVHFERRAREGGLEGF
ncbi:MAG: ABC transporter permease [Candidatus Bipolaricaulota bacterium]|nr:ABC transporter permease [Candidatus Bipolaricaulota bacterium]